MDNNFEQQFTETVKTTTPQEVASPITGSGSKLPLIIIIALVLVVLIESIALTITLNNYFSLASGTEEGEDSDEAALDETDHTYYYNTDGTLGSVDLICSNSDGTKFVFKKNNNYQEYGQADALISAGTYTVTNNSLFAIQSTDSNNRVLYYDGFTVADGLKIYNCEENGS